MISLEIPYIHPVPTPQKQVPLAAPRTCLIAPRTYLLALLTYLLALLTYLVAPRTYILALLTYLVGTKEIHSPSNDKQQGASEVMTGQFVFRRFNNASHQFKL